MNMNLHQRHMKYEHDIPVLFINIEEVLLKEPHVKSFLSVNFMRTKGLIPLNYA